MAMRVNFLNQLVRDTVIILKEGNLPNPRCPWCNMLVPWKYLSRWHITTDQCTKGVEWKIRRFEEEEKKERAERFFQAYGRPPATFTSFTYLGQILTAVDDNWPTVVGNLRKLQKSWARMARILGREGYIPRISGKFFKAVVRAVLLFWTEMWVMTSCMGRTLGGFQHRVDRHIMERQTKRQVNGSWE